MHGLQYDILVEELEQLSSGVLVESVLKLSDRGWDLETLAQDDLLPLKADVTGPLDEAGQIPDGVNVLAYFDVMLNFRI